MKILITLNTPSLFGGALCLRIDFNSLQRAERNSHLHFANKNQ